MALSGSGDENASDGTNVAFAVGKQTLALVENPKSFPRPVTHFNPDLHSVSFLQLPSPGSHGQPGLQNPVEPKLP